MDTAAQILTEINEWAWTRFKDALTDLPAEEIEWRPLAESNSINAIIRHLRIEARFHLAALGRGEPLPFEPGPGVQKEIDAIPLDFKRNLEELERSFTGYLAALRASTLPAVQQQTAVAYQKFPSARSLPEHLLGFHHAVHLVLHLGQIRMIRNLYAKRRGEPARFFPENPMFPD